MSTVLQVALILEASAGGSLEDRWRMANALVRPNEAALGFNVARWAQHQKGEKRRPSRTR
jgi:hypothetical protein